MPVPTPRDLEAARDRLRGHLVETPLIGIAHLPGRVVPRGLRIKPEVLQPSGSIHFRGAMHYLLRQLGALKGLAAHGALRQVMAAAFAAEEHRLPMVAFPVGEPPAPLWSLLTAAGCEVRPQPTPQDARAAAEEVRTSKGYHVMPGPEHADYLAGLATAGLELAAELPAEVQLVLVSPTELTEPIALGLAAGNASVRVQGVDENACNTPEDLGALARTALRLDLGAPSLGALQWALEHEAETATCVVLAW